MALIDKKDLTSKVKEIFKLQPKIGSNCVYVLEEFHILKHEDQTIFLEELSNVPKDVYIVICTNQMFKVIPEIRGRSTRFDVKVPNTEECIVLIKDFVASKEAKQLSEKTYRWIIKHLGNVPGEIIKVVDLLIDSDSFNESMAKGYLGFMETEKYVEFFEMCNKSMFEFVNYLDTVKESDLDSFYRGLKEFVLNLMSTLYGGSKSTLNKPERDKLVEAFKNFNEKKFLEFMEYTNSKKYDDKTDLYYKMIGYRRFFNDESLREVVVNSKKEAVVAEIRSVAQSNERAFSKSERDTTLSIEKIQDILGNIHMVGDDNEVLNKSVSKPVLAEPVKITEKDIVIQETDYVEDESVSDELQSILEELNFDDDLLEPKEFKSLTIEKLK